ncbi:MAG: hypothetical protein NTX50_00920 [Candidatus Sumerlaeota bacterium]|nr:hypothetical protein [Candidatus Sumerlaeota bacterium]
MTKERHTALDTVTMKEWHSALDTAMTKEWHAVLDTATAKESHAVLDTALLKESHAASEMELAFEQTNYWSPCNPKPLAKRHIAILLGCLPDDFLVS